MRCLVKVRRPDQIDYAEACLILNRGIHWVQALVDDGELGITSNQHGARLCRREVEAMALQVWRRERHREGGYWCTQADAARLLGLSKQNVPRRGRNDGYTCQRRVKMHVFTWTN